MSKNEHKPTINFTWKQGYSTAIAVLVLAFGAYILFLILR